MNPKEIKQKIRQLAFYQNGLTRQEYPTTNSEVLEELFQTRSEILKSFGLPETPEYLGLLDFEDKPTDDEIESTLDLLKSAATAYLLSTPIPDMQLLSEAQNLGIEAMEVLPLLHVSIHLYTLFVYQNILLTGKDSPMNVYEALKKADKPQILEDLGKLALCGSFHQEEKELLARLSHSGIHYLHEYLSAYRTEGQKEEWQISLLEEFMSDLEGTFEFESIEQRLDTLAYYLQNYLCLVASGHPYRIVECEMYYHDPALHPDPYTHKKEEQLSNGTWYFNDFGLDISFGNVSKSIYAGILIRGIQSLVDQERYISGPSKVVRELFKQFGNICSKDSHLYLRELEKGLVKEQDPIKTTRIGLTKRENDTENFKEKPYRYLVELKVQHKFPEKEKVLRSLVVKGKITPELAKEFMGYSINLSK